MKYLKKYKLFESLFNEDVINELDDILLELKDLGYFVDLGVISPNPFTTKIRVFIGGIAKSNFTYDGVVKEVFERMTDYMENEGFNIIDVFYSTPEDPASHFSISLRDYKNGVLNGKQNKEIGTFHHLQISFTPK